MKNLEYWRTSLENVLEKEEITDKLIEKLIGISEMEYEYTEFESHKPVEYVNPLQQKLDTIEKDNEILKKFIEKQNEVDTVSIENGEVKFYNKLP